MTLGEMFVLAAIMSQVSRSRWARWAWTALTVPLGAVVLWTVASR